jgi:hypothetical protein
MTPEDAKKLHPGDRLENRIGYLPVRGVVVRLTPTGFIAKWESRDAESGVIEKSHGFESAALARWTARASALRFLRQHAEQSSKSSLEKEEMITVPHLFREILREFFRFWLMESPGAPINAAS